MSNVLSYKGYSTKIEYSAEDQVIFGRIEGIVDSISFHSEAVAGIEKSFQDAVDDYLELCAEVGKQPDKPYKGTFNVRISPALHKLAAQIASRNGCSLNEFVQNAIEDRVKRVNEKEVTIRIIGSSTPNFSIEQSINKKMWKESSRVLNFSNKYREKEEAKEN